MWVFNRIYHQKEAKCSNQSNGIWIKAKYKMHIALKRGEMMVSHKGFRTLLWYLIYVHPSCFTKIKEEENYQNKLNFLKRSMDSLHKVHLHLWDIMHRSILYVRMSTQISFWTAFTALSYSTLIQMGSLWIFLQRRKSISTRLSMIMIMSLIICTLRM